MLASAMGLIYFMGATILSTIVLSMELRPTAFPPLVAKRGRIFSYELKPEVFFSRRYDGERFSVHYSANVKGYPDIPKWLNIAQLANGSTAFLYGTPEQEDDNVELLVYALNRFTYQLVNREFLLYVINDSRMPDVANQMAELWIQNFDIFDVLSSENLLRHLQSKVSRAFKGPGGRSYLRSIRPSEKSGSTRPSNPGSDSKGIVLTIATKGIFHNGIRLLARGLQVHPEQCKRNSIIPMDSVFAPEFQIDWCHFKLLNSTKPFDEHGTAIAMWRNRLMPVAFEKKLDGETSLHLATAETAGANDTTYRSFKPSEKERVYIWDWITVVAVSAAVVIILILVLSVLFFGCREGQHWRDYKTPRNQLKEYLRLRNSQSTLRDMSLKRQSVPVLDTTLPTEMLISSGGKNQAQSPPAYRPQKPVALNPYQPVGKQTVAQAAELVGASLHLYTEPESEDELSLRAEEGAGGVPDEDIKFITSEKFGQNETVPNAKTQGSRKTSKEKQQQSHRSLLPTQSHDTSRMKIPAEGVNPNASKGGRVVRESV